MNKRARGGGECRDGGVSRTEGHRSRGEGVGAGEAAGERELSVMS